MFAASPVKSVVVNRLFTSHNQPAKDGGRTQAHNTVGAIGYPCQPPTRNVTGTSNTPTPGGCPPTHWPPHCRQAQTEDLVEAEARDNRVIVTAM
jgi:hypothetical protein